MPQPRAATKDDGFAEIEAQILADIEAEKARRLEEAQEKWQSERKDRDDLAALESEQGQDKAKLETLSNEIAAREDKINGLKIKLGIIRRAPSRRATSGTTRSRRSAEEKAADDQATAQAITNYLKGFPNGGTSAEIKASIGNTRLHPFLPDVLAQMKKDGKLIGEGPRATMKYKLPA